MISRTYEFSCQKVCRSHRTEGSELWTLTVQTKDLPLGFKYGPNARYAELDTRAAKDMLETLATDPGSFIFKNNGIMVVADSLKSEGTEVCLICSESEPEEDAPGHGVLNGGHTYKVLQHALESKDAKFEGVGEQAFVTLTVGIGIPDEEIWRISRARNTSEKVPLHALRELAGDWSIVKANLPEASRHLVAFKPNDPEAPDELYDTTDLIRRLALLNNKMFPAEQGSHPVAAYTSIGSVVKKYTPSSFAEVAPLLRDALKLEELIVRHWEDIRGKGGEKISITKASGCSAQPSQLLSGYNASITLADPFVLPVLAAFRVFVVNGRWAMPMEELWEKYGPRTVRSLWEAYRETGKSSAAVFGRAKGSWAAACDLTKSAAIQMKLILIADTAPEPTVTPEAVKELDTMGVARTYTYRREHHQKGSVGHVSMGASKDAGIVYIPMHTCANVPGAGDSITICTTTVDTPGHTLYFREVTGPDRRVRYTAPGHSGSWVFHALQMPPYDTTQGVPKRLWVSLELAPA